jgi:hypothetical protein
MVNDCMVELIIYNVKESYGTIDAVTDANLKLIERSTACVNEWKDVLLRLKMLESKMEIGLGMGFLFTSSSTLPVVLC